MSSLNDFRNPKPNEDLAEELRRLFERIPDTPEKRDAHRDPRAGDQQPAARAWNCTLACRICHG